MELVFKINMWRLIWYTISYTMRFFICIFSFYFIFYICVCVFLTAYCAPIKNSSDNGKSLGYSTTFWMDTDLENCFGSLIIYNNFIMSHFLWFFIFYFYFLIIYLVSFPHNDAPIHIQIDSFTLHAWDPLWMDVFVKTVWRDLFNITIILLCVFLYFLI